MALRGTHLIKQWSCTQRAVTLSSAEAELYGFVKATTEALGIHAWGRDLGLEMAVRMHADSAAAIGICRRSGIGRVRHLAVGQLWVQEGLRRGDFTLFKVRGDQNPADLLTKSVPREVLDRHLRALGLARTAGRAESAPQAQLLELAREAQGRLVPRAMSRSCWPLAPSDPSARAGAAEEEEKASRRSPVSCCFLESPCILLFSGKYIVRLELGEHRREHSSVSGALPRHGKYIVLLELGEHRGEHLSAPFLAPSRCLDNFHSLLSLYLPSLCYLFNS